MCFTYWKACGLHIGRLEGKQRQIICSFTKPEVLSGSLEKRLPCLKPLVPEFQTGMMCTLAEAGVRTLTHTVVWCGTVRAFAASRFPVPDGGEGSRSAKPWGPQFLRSPQ